MVVADDYTVASAILEASSYYPFGLQKKHIGVSQQANPLHNKYTYNGKELQEDLGLDQYDYGVGFQDPELGIWHNIDPNADNYFSRSPYVYALNDPISTIDIDRRDTKSTYTDSLGNVLAVFNDGDNGVYNYNGTTSTDQFIKDHSVNNTGAGGKRVGETLFWDELLNMIKKEISLGTNMAILQIVIQELPTQ